jgi:hypothetical protein
MKSYRHFLFTFLFLQLYAGVQAQVEKNVVVEHFTNTRCSICASRNPGFYTNLGGQSNVLHLAIHPSNPYSNCVLNNHNTSENDARTKFYGLFNGTPRLVIQGEVINVSADYSSAAIFTPYKGQVSPLAVTILLAEQGSDSITTSVIVKTVAANTLGELSLFAAATEEQVNYAAPNGEKVHHDVFRKSYFEISGKTFTPAATIGDSVVLTGIVAKSAAWIASNMYTLAIVSETANKRVVQAARSEALNTSTGFSEKNLLESSVFPVPAGDYLEVIVDGGFKGEAVLYDLGGRIVQKQSFESGQRIPVADLAPGMYQLHLTGSRGIAVKKVSISR